MSAVAVFDVGKTNVKLTAAGADGCLLETLSTPNPSRPGPPYRHHDVGALERWLVEGLRTLARRHAIAAVVACAHGSGGVLVGDDGPVLPMVDYEQALPPAVDAEYREVAGSFRERGSPVMLGAAHLARQMLWLERGWPDRFAGARHFLATPQYWAWRLSGVAASEVTSLAAQSHLWSPADARFAALVGARNWGRLMPPLAPAWATLGPLAPAFIAATGLMSGTRVLCGIHDSSANLYRYQAAGLADLVVVSTGTWIVAISDRGEADFDAERPGFTGNADVRGRPLPGMLTMGGREFSAVAGNARASASPDDVVRLVDSGTMALPSFGGDDGLFPGTARSGVLVGPLADDLSLRPALAVLYAALLTERCLDALAGATIALDGSFVRHPLYGALVAALSPGRRVVVNRDQYGTATGAALLASHESRTTPAPLSLEHPAPFPHPDLPAYRARWRERALSRRP